MSQLEIQLGLALLRRPSGARLLGVYTKKKSQYRLLAALHIDALATEQNVLGVLEALAKTGELFYLWDTYILPTSIGVKDVGDLDIFC
jgi:hypothetical protein